jgi:phenolic acid decarboxylase
MKIFIIAQIVNGNDIVGYRMLDVDDKNKVLDIPLNNLVQTLGSPQGEGLIKNAKLVNGKVTGTNGSLSRYAKVDANTGRLVDASPLVVINKIEDVGYTVADFNGRVVKMKNSDVVDYAKKNGIANGKVVIQDGVEFISSISDTYEVKKISPSKVGKTRTMGMPIHISNNNSSIAKHTREDVDTEIQYTDVFAAMTAEQRNTLKQYYSWYTVDEFEKLAHSVRLSLAPGKAEKLAALRGVDDWVFAGINDSYLEKRFDAKCELGHNLRYEYFAIPDDSATDKDRQRHRGENWKERLSSFDALRENGAIVFGEKCSADFFNISTDDMKKLVKTRKNMTEEIELTSNVITNHLEKEYMEKCKLLYSIIQELGSASEVVRIFGDKVGYTLLMFIKTNIPFVKSLVLLAGEKARENKKELFKALYKKNADLIDIIYSGGLSNGARQESAVLDHIVTYSIEGKYQYDPLHDEERTRRDIGKYNEETRNERRTENAFFFSRSLIRDDESLEEIQGYLATLDMMYTIFGASDHYIRSRAEDVECKYPASNTSRRGSRYLPLQYFLNDMYTWVIYNTDRTDVNSLTDYSAVISSLSVTNRYSRRPDYKNLIPESRMGRDYNTVLELKEVVETALGNSSDINTLVVNTVGKYIDAISADERAKREERLNKISYCVALLNDDTGNRVLFEADKDTKLALQNNQSHMVNTIGHEEMNVQDFKSVEFISTFEYNAYKIRMSGLMNEPVVKESRTTAKRADAYLSENGTDGDKADAGTKDKVQLVKELLDQYKGDMDYGLMTAQNIASRGIAYDKLSDKQRWRIDKTYEILTDTSSNGQSTQVNEESSNKNLLKDHHDVSEKIEKLLEIRVNGDMDALAKINTASRIVYNIIQTVERTGEYSDKQLKHIEKAYEVIK